MLGAMTTFLGFPVAPKRSLKMRMTSLQRMAARQASYDRGPALAARPTVTHVGNALRIRGARVGARCASVQLSRSQDPRFDLQRHDVDAIQPGAVVQILFAAQCRQPAPVVSIAQQLR